ncbi:MAG TPA: HmuY family protein [Polyangiaceae bacterium]|nr:HmuY family protein [Polyangiaceae bacterium]
MVTKKLGTLALTALLVLSLGAACSSDDDDSSAETGGKGGASSNGGKGGSSAGSGASAGTAGKSQGGSTGSAGAGTAGNTTAGSSDNDAMRGEGGTDAVGGGAAGVGGESGGQGGADAAGGRGEGGGAGAGGGAEWSACETVRSGLLGPIASVSTGTVEVTSGAAALVTVIVDASAGGYAAAGTNPYIYVNLASKTAVAVSDPAADTALTWDLAFKRDNIRSNGGDSGAGSAQVAALDGADFDAVTSAAVASADFGSDEFIDHYSCESILDAANKPLTRFDGWYDYDAVSNGLTPANKVYLVRGANGTSLYKLKITGYYVDVSDGAGGTVKKSAVFSLKYQAL